MTRCVAPLDLDILSGYWAGEISEQDTAASRIMCLFAPIVPSGSRS